MIFSVVSTLIALVASATAVPVLQGRQTGASCAGFSEASTDTTVYNFTLAAYNLTLPNANATGAPLVLGYGPPGDSAAASEWAISTYASWGVNDWPYFTLQSGALYPQPGPNENGLGAYDFQVQPGSEVAFFVTVQESSPSPAEIYCAVDNSTEYSVLAVNNDADNFSLCVATADWTDSPQYNIVYQPEANATQYTYNTCYPVRVQLIPL
ncbi:hypothetical protein WOLCODRAFT_139557 [Wolfiporia cocos MD-104 SS10]|uniref:Uncharacterized protein n=1 Tax=Wolfiporia cocos (strain MD-104) TaxID=742152 RepID=A0A2H3IXM9_WOLCO|nr:hypothetical protein WOLCODRAFT_139557 [Wolfiporia cocos MD-104 SS10]